MLYGVGFFELIFGPSTYVTQKLLVYDAETKKPITGAQIQLYRGAFGPEPFAWAKTDSNGCAVFNAKREEARPGCDVSWHELTSAQGYETWYSSTNACFAGYTMSTPLKPIGSARSKEPE